MAESRLELVIDSRSAERELRRLEGRLQGVDRAGDRAQGATSRLNSEIGGLRTVALAASGALAAMGVASFGRDVFDAVASSEKLRASLKTVTGSVEAATQAWDELLVFASETPFTLDQSVRGFIRMKSLGLDPTTESLRSFGNTASAMGTDLMQMVEAVADATTGEFERLKAFGIQASKEGDQITFTFQGVETTVRNTSTAINDYLEAIGNNEFGGAMVEQMETLGGASSNLEDSIYQLYIAIGNAGATDIFNAALDGSISTVNYLEENIETLAKGFDLLSDAAIIAAGIFGGRFVAAMAAGTVAAVNRTAASIAGAKADAAAAAAATRRTGAELAAARAMLSSAQMDVVATRGTAAHTFALNQLSAARVRTATAAGAHSTATNVATAAMGRASIAARGLSGAMALVGGPLGIALIAAGSLYYFREELGLVESQTSNTQKRIDALTGSMGEMGKAALTSAIASVTAEMQFLEDQAWNTQRVIDNLGEGETFGGSTKSELETQLEYIGRDFENAKDKVKSLQAQEEALSGTSKHAAVSTEKLASSTGELSGASDDAAKAAKRQADALGSLLDTLYPLKKSQREYKESVDVLTRSYMRGDIDQQRYEDSLKRLEQSYRNSGSAAEAYGLEVTGTARDVANAAGPMAQSWEEAAKRIDETFADAFTGAFDNFEDFGDQLLDGFKRLLGELAYQATLKPIVVQMTSAAGGGMGLSGGGQSGSGGMGDITSIGKQLYGGGGQTAGNAFRAFQGTGSTYSGQFGSSLSATGNGGFGPGYNSLAASGIGSAALSAGAGVAGAYAGTELGSALTGKEANSNIGAMAGAALGQAFIPIPVLGAAIGGAVGGFLDSAFGSSGPELDLALQRGDSKLYDDRGNWDEGVRSRSAFGTVGLNEDGTHDINSAWDPKEAQKLFDGIAKLDNSLAALANTPQELQAMTDAVMAPKRDGVQGYYGETSTPGKVVEILANRYKSAIDTLDSAFEDTILGIESGAQDLVSTASNLSAFEKAVGDNYQSMADARLQLATSSDIRATAKKLNQQAQAMAALGDAAGQLNLTFGETAFGALHAAGNMAELVGGLGNLSALQSQYYDAFYSDAEKFGRLSDSLSERFNDLGVALPETQKGVRSLVEGLDLMTQSGREQYAAVMQLVPSLSKYVDGMQAQREAIEASTSSLSNTSLSGIGGAIGDYKDAVSLSKTMANQRKAQLQDELQAVESLGNLIDSLMLSNQSILDPLERLQESQRQFAALQVRAESGDTGAASRLQGASSSYLDSAAGYYGQSSSQYASIFGDVTNSVSDLEAQFGASVDSLGSLESIQDQALREQKRARDILVRSLETEIDAYGELTTLTDLLAILPDNLANALSAILPEKNTPSGNSYVSGGNDDEGDPLLSGAFGAVSDAYRDILGRDPDDSGLAYYRGEYTSGRMGLDEIRDRLEDSPESRFATGGAFTNGIVSRPTEFSTGLMGEAGPEAIMPLTNVGGSLGVRVTNEGSGEMVRELQGLRAEVAALRAERRQDAGQAASQRGTQIREQQKTSRNTKSKVTTV